MRAWSVLRALTRVELRELLRHPSRSALVVLLVAVPVAAVVGGTTLVRVTAPTPSERKAQVLGRAPMRVDARRGQSLEGAHALLGPEAHTTWIERRQRALRVHGQRLHVMAVTVHEAVEHPAGPLWTGRFRITHGHAPRRVHEVALSPTLAAELKVEPGQTVELESGRRYAVTGWVVDPENVKLPLMLFRAASPSDLDAQYLLVQASGVELGRCAPLLREQGFQVTRRGAVGEGRSPEADAIFVVGGLGFLEAALVIAAAFGVSLRRRQRDIGLLRSCGAPIPALRRSILLSAVILSLVGSVVGVAVGVGAATLMHPYLDGWNGRWNGPLEISTEHLIGAIALGVVTSLLATALPARSASRLPVRVALGGRRPITTESRGWLLIGIALLGAGIGTIAWGVRDGVSDAAVRSILLGSILSTLGVGASSPWILKTLARFATALPLSWRLAVRDASRFRSRYGPVVTAILAMMAVTVTLYSLIAATESLASLRVPSLRDDHVLVEGAAAEDVAAELVEAFPESVAAPLRAAWAGNSIVRTEAPGPRGLRWVACGEDSLHAVLGSSVRSSGDVADDVLIGLDALEDSADVTLVMDDARYRLPRGELLDAELESAFRGPAFVATDRWLERHGLWAGPPPTETMIPWLVRLPSRVSERHFERARAIAAAHPLTSVDAELTRGRPELVFFRIVLLIAVVSSWIVIVVATSLSAAESAEDTRVLESVGASPSLMRRHAAARSAYLGLLGCLLSVPAGLIPAAGLAATSDVLEFAVPWSRLASAVLVLPVVAYTGTWFWSALRQRLHSAAHGQPSPG